MRVSVSFQPNVLSLLLAFNPMSCIAESNSCGPCSRHKCVSFGSFQTAAPSVHQNGLLASTAYTFLQRLVFIMFGCFRKTCTSLRREAHLGRLGCLLEAPAPTREASRTPKALEGRGLDRLGCCLLEAPGSSLGGLPAASGPQRHPKVVPGTGTICGQ